MEHKSLPIFATMFHPEKNQFEKLAPYHDLDRSFDTTQAILLHVASLVQTVKNNRSSPRPFDDVPHKILQFSSFTLVPEAAKEEGYYETNFYFGKYSELTDEMKQFNAQKEPN